MNLGIDSAGRRQAAVSLTMLVRLAVLVAPAALLVVGSMRGDEEPSKAKVSQSSPPAAVGATAHDAKVYRQSMLYLGSVFQILLFSWLMLSQRVLTQPLGFPVSIVYLTAFAWLWLAGGIRDDWFSHLAQAVLLVFPLFFFGLKAMGESGVFASRRARLLAQRLASKTDWPNSLEECRSLPEVKQLRDALREDPNPALALLKHRSPHVRMVALAALDSWHIWQPGQADLILHLAREAREPAIRAAALLALSEIEDRPLVEMLAEFLRDPAREVRQAAAQALRWDNERRWNWARNAIRIALSDGNYEKDGALKFDGPPLKPDVVADLQAWAAEKGTLGVRAALTLGNHYGRALSEQSGGSGLVPTLKQQLADPHAPPALRMELGQILQSSGELDRSLAEHLLDPANPGPLRLLAAEAILAEGPFGPAVAALRDIARLPNREMALSAADIVQRRLGVDLGLALGQPLPPLHGRQAADVTRRLMKWAANQEITPTDAETASSGDIDPGQSPDPRDWGQTTPQHKDRDRGSGFRGMGSGVG